MIFIIIPDHTSTRFDRVRWTRVVRVSYTPTSISCCSLRPRLSWALTSTSVTGKFPGSLLHRLMIPGLHPLRNCIPKMRSSIHLSPSAHLGIFFETFSRIFLKALVLFHATNHEDRLAKNPLDSDDPPRSSVGVWESRGRSDGLGASMKPNRPSKNARWPHLYCAWRSSNSARLSTRMSSFCIFWGSNAGWKESKWYRHLETCLCSTAMGNIPTFPLKDFRIFGNPSVAWKLESGIFVGRHYGYVLHKPIRRFEELSSLVVMQLQQEDLSNIHAPQTVLISLPSLVIIV